MKLTLLPLLMLTLFWGMLFSETTFVSAGNNGVRVISSSPEETILQFDVSRFDQTQVTIDGQKWHHIYLEKEGITQDKGEPALPVFNRSIIIPNTALMRFDIYDAVFQDMQLTIAPSKGVITRDINPATVPYTFSQTYANDRFYPENIVSLSDPYIMRDFRGITVRTMPFAYNPVTGTLRVFTSYKIRVFSDGVDTINIMPGSRDSISRAFQPIYENHFVNYSQYRYTPVSDSFGKLLVICHTNYMTDILPYVNWKKQRGIETELVNFTTVGTTAAQLQTYIQNRYNTDNTITYVQLVGDAPQIPTLSSGGGGADPMFALVAGGDNYPDIFIGRFSAETSAQVTAQINKAIVYERDLNVIDTWLKNALGIASAEGGGSQGDNGESDIQHMNIIRTRLMTYGYTSVDQVYDPGASAATVTTNVNAGRGIINYVGHGSDTSWVTTGFSSANATNLTNGRKTPVIMDVACVNGNFVSITCFAEAWLRNANGGAVTMYASTINQSWNSPMRGQDEFNELLTNVSAFGGRKYTAGGLYYNAACRMMDVYGNTTGSDGVNMYRTWTIFGDASLSVRTTTPLAMNVNHPANISIGQNTVSVSTGVANTLVGITYNNTLYGKGYTDGSGNTAINLVNAPQTAITYTITATALDRITYVGSIQQVPSAGTYLNVSSVAYSDSNNNLPEYNETGRYSVTIQNIGNATASDITATISTSASGITFTDNTESIASLAAGASVTRTNAFAFGTANNIPDQLSVPMTITMVSGADNWTHNFSQVFNAPALALGSVIIQDPLGNNNGRLDPGETVTVLISLANNGGAASPAGNGYLTCSTPGITVNTGTAAFTTLSSAGGTNLSFNITASSGMSVGMVVSLQFNATAGAYTANKTENVTVGLILEDFETGNFNSYPWVFGGSLPWTVTNTGAYQGTYVAKSGTITHSQTSYMETTRILSSAGQISFWYKVSSETSYDYLRFYIDGVQQNQWSGTVGWTQATYAVTAGTRTFRWLYYKDGSVNTGDDCAWVDYIVFPASTAPNVYNPPQNLAATSSHAVVNLTWQAPASGTPTVYKVFRNSTLLTTVTGLTYQDLAVTNGTTYSYHVKAVYSGGESDASNTVNATPASNPPQNLAAVAGITVVNLTWQAATGRGEEERASRDDDRAISGYRVYRNGSSIGTTNSSTLSYSDTNVVNETTYAYHVTTLYSNPAGESAASNSVQATPTAQTALEAILGTGTTVNSTTVSSPVNIYYRYRHGQMVYTRAELIASGVFGPLNITQLGFYVTQSPAYAMPNYVIRMKHTTATDVSIIHTATGMSTVYNNTGYLPPAGNWNMLTLNTPFLWNGTDNIVVDFAFGIVNPNYSSTGQCRVYTATNGYRHWQSDSVDQTTNFTGGAVLNTKPQIRMVFAPVVGNDPAIAVNPTTINETLVPDQSVQRTVTISNTGTATLNWQIGGMNSWVTVNTSSGNITAGQNQNISLSLTSDGLSDGVYNQTLTITSNATNNPNVNVNISMTVFNPFPNQPRYVAEFEPMAAALIRYPLGIPYTIVRELAADNLLYTVVSSANQTTAYNNYVSNNVNIANCRWIIAASDSYWIRDYGPWFIMDGNNEMKVVDFAYNRPRPTDDAIPAAVANNLGIGIYQSGIIHSGGNIMTDGEGKAMSTNLVLTENPSLTQSQVNMIMQNYLGVTEYQLYNDPNGTYINHIDCWAKILDVDKVMIRSVPPSHSQYGQIEAVVTSFQSKTSSWGTPYQIFRVNTPNNEPYSNAYILNKKIFVPLMNNANDAAAITAFQNAMPGYSVIGFLAGTNAWASTDAIHCRINAIPDQQMIHIHHIPPQNIASGITVEIETMITNHNALIPGDVYVAWRHNPTDPWTHTQMTNTSGILWAASIPTPDLGQTLYYMINAQDTSLRQRTVPLCGKDDPFKVLVTQVGYMPPPEPILNFTNDTASLSWTPIPHATFYEIYACDTPDGEFALIGTCNGVSWSEPLRTNVQTRFYQIKAIHLTE